MLWELISWIQFFFDSLIILVGALITYRFYEQWLKDFILSFFARSKLQKYQGGWAVVTGGSEGIGFGIAMKLAENGFNILLISRNSEKLEKAKKAIQAKCNVQVEFIQADFSICQNAVEYYENLVNQFKQYDVSILVNNVGMGGKPYFESSLTEVKQMVITNTLSQLLMTRFVIPQLINRGKPTALINISSIASIMQGQTSILYSATKAFNRDLSHSIYLEMKDQKKLVDVLTVVPGYVDTEMTQNIKGKFLEASIEELGQNVVNCLGNVNYVPGTLKQWILEIILEIYPALVAKNIKVGN